jgi:hypothetical protein
MIIAGAASLALMPADTPTLWLPAVLLAPLLTFSLAALVSDTPALAEIEGENPDEVPLAALVLGSTRASLAAIRAWSGRIGLD